jgi:hypothetical protein
MGPDVAVGTTVFTPRVIGLDGKLQAWAAITSIKIEATVSTPFRKNRLLISPIIHQRSHQPLAAWKWLPNYKPAHRHCIHYSVRELYKAARPRQFLQSHVFYTPVGHHKGDKPGKY